MPACEAAAQCGWCEYRGSGGKIKRSFSQENNGVKQRLPLNKRFEEKLKADGNACLKALELGITDIWKTELNTSILSVSAAQVCAALLKCCTIWALPFPVPIERRARWPNIWALRAFASIPAPYKHLNEKLLKSGFKWDTYYPDKKIDSKYIMLTEDKRIFKIHSYNVFRDCDSFKQIDINLI